MRAELLRDADGGSAPVKVVLTTLLIPHEHRHNTAHTLEINDNHLTRSYSAPLLRIERQLWSSQGLSISSLLRQRISLRDISHTVTPFLLPHIFILDALNWHRINNRLVSWKKNEVAGCGHLRREVQVYRVGRSSSGTKNTFVCFPSKIAVRRQRPSHMQRIGHFT